MKGRIITVFIILATLGLGAQESVTPWTDIYLPATPATTDTAANFSIGKSTLMAGYHEQGVYFLLDFRYGTVTVSTDNHDDQEFQATISQVAPIVYRADISDYLWIELNAITGETIVHQRCLSRVFRNVPATYTGTPR